MAKISQPPIREKLIDEAGNLHRAWIQWFMAIYNKTAATQSDAVAVSAIAAVSGSDSIDLTTFNDDLSTLVTEINAIKDILNELVDKLQDGNVMV